MNISVVVPTYKRLHDLKRCLIALDNQTTLPHEVIVVANLNDLDTILYIQNWTSQQNLYIRKFSTVGSRGMVQAMIQGVEVASGEVIAFTDDDSEPDPTWLLKMERHYQDAKVGGVGGRDILCNHPPEPLRAKVGKLTWYGKLIGNHHLGFGPPREVDVLKGVNMSFKKDLIKFSKGLKSDGGPENHNEVGLCLRVRRLGHSLIYDPEILVNHYVSPRIDSEQRFQFSAGSVRDSAFNIQMSLLIWLPWHQKLFRVFYSTLIGDKAYPGLVRFLIAVVKWQVRVVRSYIPAQVGFLLAIVHCCRTTTRDVTSTDSPRSRTRHKATTEDV